MRRFKLYPLYIALYPIAALYVHNFSETPLSSLGLAVLLALGVTGLLYLLGFGLSREPGKAALWTACALLLFYSYGHIHSALLSIYANHRFAKADFELLDALVKQEALLHWFLMPAMLVVVGLGSWFILRRTIPEAVHKLASAFSLVLLLLPLAGALPAIVHASRRGNLDLNSVETGQASSGGDLQSLPDIYFIVLDGYARADVLKTFYGFDNSPFISHLEGKGFYVAPYGRSNYDYTFLSLPSMLNMTHLKELAAMEGPGSTDLTVPYRMIRENRVTKMLKAKGYTYVHMNSTWAATRRNPMADYTIAYGGDIAGDEFLRVLAETTLLKPFVAKIDHRLADIHRHGLAGLYRIPDMEAPTFTFAHFTPPHYPYVFDRDGNVVRDAPLSRQFATSEWDKQDLYIGQLMFMNREITKLVDHILAHSKRPPIILLVSDHGPKAGQTMKDYVQVRMGNLAAFHFPGETRNKLYPNITPVNYFRILFQGYFGEDLPLLPDRSFMSGRMDTPYVMRPLPPEKIPAPPAP